MGGSPMIAQTRGPAEVVLDQLTELFRLLSDKTRLNILMLLHHEEQNVTALCKRLNLPQPTVSHHLGLLRMNSLIDNRRSGKQVFYGLSGRFTSSNEGVLNFRGDHFTVRVELPAPSA